MPKTISVVIVMPAYNAEKTVKETFFEIPENNEKNIILVDDHSKDKTEGKINVHASY